MTRPAHLLVALLAAAAAACDQTVYDAIGVPRAGPLVCADPGTHACTALDVCARDDDAERCEADCHPCTTDVPGARAICVANTCGYECPAGLLQCATGCCPAAAVSAGGDHACAVTEGTRELLCWGANNDGQLGIGDASGLDQPTPRKVPLAKRVVAVAAGIAHSCAVVEGGETWCWGRASSFASGADYVYTPRAVPRLSDSGPNAGAPSGVGAKAIAAGGGHTCAVFDDGVVKCAGAWNPGGIPDIAVASGATRVAAGNDFSCAIVNGDMRCWGANDRGELGAPDVPLQPATIALPGPAAAVELGWEHGCAAPADPLTPIHCWGTPLGVATPPATPHPVPDVTYPAAALAAGEAHTCALDGGGAVECWGETAADVVVGGAPPFPGAPVRVALEGPALAIDAGLNHTCAILGASAADAAGRVVCWGRASRGQLGAGGVDSATPVPIVSR